MLANKPPTSIHHALGKPDSPGECVYVYLTCPMAHWFLQVVNVHVIMCVSAVVFTVVGVVTCVSAVVFTAVGVVTCVCISCSVHSGGCGHMRVYQL